MTEPLSPASTAAKIREPTRADIPESGMESPLLRYIGKNKWRLEEDYLIQGPDRCGVIPKGFVFDLASVPRFLWPFIAPFELTIAAPLAHDYLYRYQGDVPTEPACAPYTRAQADRIFEQLMAREGIPWLRRQSAWAAVRAFGWASWGG